MTDFKGTASIAAMAPLLMLRAVADTARLTMHPEGGWSTTLPTGEKVWLRLDPTQTVHLTIRAANGSAVFGGNLQAFGDSESEAYWFPLVAFEDWETSTDVHSTLAAVSARIHALLDNVSFVESEEGLLANMPRAAAALNYLRMKSGVTDNWHISLAQPHEIRVDEACWEDGGLVCALGDLPPGCEKLCETALIEIETADIPSWCMRPATLTLDGEVGDNNLTAVQIARDKLVALGFTNIEIRSLDRTAAEITEAYEFSADDVDD